MTLLDAIPEDHRSAVAAALAQVFGEAEVSLIERLAGVSALGVFHLRVEGAGDFVLRLDPRRDDLRDTYRQAACIRIASEGGVTPQHVRIDADEGISIARFVAAAQTPWAERLAEAASLTRRLHSLPLFAAHTPYRAMMETVAGDLAQAPVLPAPVTAQIKAAFAQALSAYPWDQDLVSSHNDLNPSNMVFDGARTWIVDWETAFAADRYIDIATLANWLTSTSEGEDEVMRGYFGEATPYQRARFHLMRQINRLFYGAMLILASAGAEEPVSQADWDANPGLDPLRAQMNKMAIHSGRVMFGCAFLKDALGAMARPAYAQALAQVREA